jgi:NAD(P)-dependent dehydrogenase (short-subunit alcohol dehydrogenase family)
MELKGKVAIITGAGRGIGRSVALDLAKEGCNLVVTSRSQAELVSLVEEVKVSGAEAIGLPLDLCLEENVDKLVNQTVSKFGTIDILINNHGVLYPEPFLEATLEHWDHTMSTNLRSVFLLSQKVLNLMKERRCGYIINVASVVAFGVQTHATAYGVSKCGMVGLSQALYEAAKEYGVKVSTVYPGITDTKMVRDLNPPTKPEQWMLPEDISYCVLFLLKQSSRMIVKDVVPWSVGYDRI